MNNNNNNNNNNHNHINELQFQQHEQPQQQQRQQLQQRFAAGHAGAAGIGIPIVPENRRLQDLDSWLELNGLRSDEGNTNRSSSNNNNNINNNNSNSNNNNDDIHCCTYKEESKRWMEHYKYQEWIHGTFFHDLDEQIQNEKKERQAFINQWPDNATIEIKLMKSTTKPKESIVSKTCTVDDTASYPITGLYSNTSNNNNNNNNPSTTGSSLVMSVSLSSTSSSSPVLIVPIKPLADSCDTILALLRNLKTLPSNTTTTIVADANSYCSSTVTSTNRNIGTNNINIVSYFSLELYPINAVYEFMEVVVTKTKSIYDIHEQYIIDCCRIAHYLQNDTLLQEIHKKILINSIDTTNCLFLCQLADQLNLNELLERSMNHMIRTIGDIDGSYTNASKLTLNNNNNNNNEKEEDSNSTDDFFMDDFVTPELRARIETIHSAIQSSIHSQRSTVYVSSIQEYIAIFAERVQYYKERLEEAKENLNSMTDRTSNCYIDVQLKINRQEGRIYTLQCALQEQKKLFVSTPSTSTSTSTSSTPASSAPASSTWSS